MRNTKRSIYTSLISLLLCISMLLGTTFAWFTDVVTSGNNVIQSGNLDAQMFYSEDYLGADDAGWIDASSEAVFKHANWEPGYTDLKYVKIYNNGSLNFKWKLTVEADGPVSDLADVIDVYYVNPVTGAITSLAGLEDKGVGTLTEVMSKRTNSTGSLLPGQSAILAIAFHMQESAGNDYKDKTLCENGFSLKLYATQDVGDSDSFGDDYDTDADWDEGSKNFTASAPISDVPIVYGALAANVNIGGTDGKSAYIPSGVKVADGATSLDLSINEVDDDNLTLGEGASATSMDVHIEGIASDNTVPMIVNLGAVLAPGLDATELKLYHIENGSPVQMTRVASADSFSIHNQYTYNAETGEVSIYVATFSVFSAVKTSADEWDGTSDTTWYNENDTEFTLTTAEQFAGFRDLVDGGKTFEGKTVKLDADIDLANEPFDPIGFGYAKDVDNDTVFKGTFDGQNHTVYNLYQNCWELDPDKEKYSTYTYSTAGAGLFASIKDATIKNIAISGAEIVFECVDMGVLVGYAQGTCHFENIVITNSKIANYNRYTGGVVGEVSYGPYGIDTSLGYSHTFKNVTVDSTVKVSGLWGSFGCGMGGVIGGKWGDATVKMENVISAAEMDVYNDVVSAYQWYAFRGCGMLIGHTEEPYSDGRHSGNATASFLTCENVKVYYGDWVNYHYYEFENQDNATGQRYPWVRAEEGEYCDAFSNIRYGVPTHGSVKVSDLTEEELKAIATDYTPIVFDQLYGADRGMYGTATHDGVTVNYKNTKTIYIENNLDWTNLKLDYWYKHGEETWTNLLESIALDSPEEENVYKLVIPSYVDSFKITSTESEEGKTFELSSFADGEHINLDGEHIHFFVDLKCVCGAVQLITEYKFTFGEDGEAKHSDGGNAVTTYEENGYTLTLKEASSLYGNASDAKGNSCIKLGTSSLIGGFSFTVPENIEKVIIYVAGYKYNNATIKINDVQYEIATFSNNGEYTPIIVDTTETKTVSLTTVDVKGESRCMINTISYGITRIVEVHDCDQNTELPTVDPTCSETGLTLGKACSVCGKVMVEQETIPTIAHTEETIPSEEATCTKNGLTKGVKCSVCEETLVEQETIPSTGHNYVESICSNCGEAFPSTSGTHTYVFSDYTAGTQYAENEEHKLDEYTKIYTTQCHFTNELRIYSSDEHNGYAIIHSSNPITVIGVNAGNNTDTINIYGSNDGVNWTTGPIGTIYVTSTSYNDYESSLNGEYKYLKIDVAGSKQIRIQSMTLTTVPDCSHASITENVVAPTCTEGGYTNTVCSSCGRIMNTVVGDPATGHVNTTTTTVDATCTVAGLVTITCDDCDATVSTEAIPTIAHTDVTTDNDHNCDLCGAENITEHNYVDGTCDCGATEPTEPTHECESICETCGGCTDAICEETACSNKCNGHNTTPTWTLVTDVSKLQYGDQIIIVAKEYNYALSTTQNDNNRGQATVTKTGSQITFGDDVQIITLVEGTKNETFAFNTGSGYLYAASSSKNYLRTETTLSDNSSWSITISDDVATIVAQGTNTKNTMQYNQSSSLFSCYESASQKAISIYRLEGGSGSTESPTCEHENKTTTTVNATCTEAGSVTVTCDDCGETISTEEVKALGHTTENGVCERCGETIGGTSEPQVTTETLEVFGNTGTLASDSSEITWTGTNVTVVNTKTKDSTAIRTSDSDHFRLYANSKLTISVKSGTISQIVITCTSSSYATVLAGSLEKNGETTATANDSIVTVTVTTGDSVAFTLSAQSRISEVEVTYSK